jgi:hypothetical protein
LTRSSSPTRPAGRTSNSHVPLRVTDVASRRGRARSDPASHRRRRGSTPVHAPTRRRRSFGWAPVPLRMHPSQPRPGPRLSPPRTRRPPGGPRSPARIADHGRDGDAGVGSSGGSRRTRRLACDAFRNASHDFPPPGAAGATGSRRRRHRERTPTARRPGRPHRHRDAGLHGARQASLTGAAPVRNDSQPARLSGTPDGRRGAGPSAAGRLQPVLRPVCPVPDDGAGPRGGHGVPTGLLPRVRRIGSRQFTQPRLRAPKPRTRRSPLTTAFAGRGGDGGVGERASGIRERRHPLGRDRLAQSVAQFGSSWQPKPLNEEAQRRPRGTHGRIARREGYSAGGKSENRTGSRRDRHYVIAHMHIESGSVGHRVPQCHADEHVHAGAIRRPPRGAPRRATVAHGAMSVAWRSKAITIWYDHVVPRGRTELTLRKRSS